MKPGSTETPEELFFALTVTLGRWPGTRTLTFAFGCFCA